MKNILIVLALVVVGGIGVYFVINMLTGSVSVDNNRDTVVDATDNTPGATESDEEENTEEEEEPIDETKTVIGKSSGGKDIQAFHYGKGDTEVLFVGGIHGGYSWNTALVAYELMDYLEENQDVIPENVKVTVIPVLNPDGLDTVTGKQGRFEVSDVPKSESETIIGRFNGNGVDLNRNFDCDWEKTGTWQSRTVSGGDNAFSEPESEAVRAYVEGKNPAAVVVWYSAAGGVFSSSCHNGVLTETKVLTNLYAKASGYKAFEEFDFYDITGDMVNWLAKEEIPAISVLLTSHNDIEWNKNKAGIEAVLEYYGQ